MRPQHQHQLSWQCVCVRLCRFHTAQFSKSSDHCCFHTARQSGEAFSHCCFHIARWTLILDHFSYAEQQYLMYLQYCKGWFRVGGRFLTLIKHNLIGRTNIYGWFLVLLSCRISHRLLHQLSTISALPKASTSLSLSLSVCACVGVC